MTAENLPIVSDEILRGLTPTGRNTKAGWIFPDGSVVPCPVMGHRGVLPEEYRSRYEEFLDGHNQYMGECLDALEEGEHPEMHRFNPETDAEDDINEVLARDGFVRFGLCVMNSKTNPVKRLELHCGRRALEKHNVLIAHIVAVLEINSVVWSDAENRYWNIKEIDCFNPSLSEGDRVNAIRKLRS